MDVLKELVRNIVVILMLTAFLDMILPSGVMRPYVKMTMGLFILIALLNPVLDLVTDNHGSEVFAWQQAGLPEQGTWRQQDSERLLSANRQVLRTAFAQRLEMQMESLLELVKEVEANVLVEMEDAGRTGHAEAIKSVVVTVTGGKEEKTGGSGQTVPPVKVPLITPVEPGRSGLPSPHEQDPAALRKSFSAEEKETEREIKDLLCRHFGLQIRQVRVVFL